MMEIVLSMMKEDEKERFEKIKYGMFNNKSYWG